jgi:hypothetical protein
VAKIDEREILSLGFAWQRRNRREKEKRERKA